MDPTEIEKITTSLPELIRLVDCNTLLISQLRSTQTIGHADECHLETFANKLERSKALLNILVTRQNGYKNLIEGLRNTKQTGALKILNESTVFEDGNSEFPLDHFAQLKISEPNSESELCKFRKVPFRTKEATKLFTGRNTELNILMHSLLPDGGTASIFGIGGVGKTELAKNVLGKLDKEPYEDIFKQIIWINCESSYSATTDFTTIAKDYLKVSIFGSSSQHRDLSSVLNDIYEKLQMSKSLIVLDNVETRETLQTYLPKANPTRSQLSILIISQNSNLKFGTQISLNSFKLDEAIEFVKKGLQISYPTSDAIKRGILELVLRLENFPLALSQAIGYIREKREIYLNYDLADYISDLERIPERLLDTNYFIDISSENKTTYKTLNLALHSIESYGNIGLLGSKILSRVAFMASENIPSSFFLDMAENDSDSLDDALALIKRFSIISLTPVCKHSTIYFSIHKLVQDVLRIRIAHENETENSIHLVLAVTCLNLSHNLIDHALEIWKHALKFKTLVTLFFGFPVALIEKMIEIGRISDGSNFLSTSLVKLKPLISKEQHEGIYFCMKALNYTLLALQDKLDDLVGKFQGIFDDAKELFSKHPKVLLKMRLMSATACIINGRFDKAALISEQLHKYTYAQKEIPLGQYLDIGQTQSLLRRYSNAQETANYVLEHLKEAPVIDREKLEFEAKSLLAENHSRMGNYYESINLFSELLDDGQVCKPQDFKRWNLLRSLGCCQYFAGLFEEAHDSFQKALNEMGASGQIRKDCWILITKLYIALVMLAINKVDKALSGATEVYEQLKEMFGEAHIFTMYSWGVVGMVYSKLGRHSDAVSILTELFENKKYVAYYGDEVGLEMYYLALSLEQMGNFEKAFEILVKLKSKLLVLPQYKLCTSEQVDIILKRLKTRIDTLKTC